MYSSDVKRIAIRLYKETISLRKVAIIIGSSHSSISRWMNKVPIERKKQKKKLGSLEILDMMKLYINSHPFCTVKDIQKTLFHTFNFKVSNELIRLTINKTLCFTKKKARYFSEPKNEKEKLKAFLDKRREYIQEDRVFVSIDETSFGRNYLPAIGYAKKGKKLYVKRPYTRITTNSVLAAISKGKPIVYMKKPGSFETNSFCDFLRSLDFPEKTVILMDNVSFHHSKKVKELIKDKNWDYLYTPPYSPIFNPIEGVFSIVKRYYSKTMDITGSFNVVSQDHISSFFRYSFNAVTKH